MVEGLKYQAQVDLSQKNSSHTQLILLTGLNKKVLEVGPATGYITKALSERGCRVTCVESDPVAAEIASPFCERMIVASIEELDFAAAFGDERFDVVMFGDVLEHLLDPSATLDKVKAVLAPQGSILASVPNVGHGSVRLALLRGEFSYSDRGLLDKTHLHFFTRKTLADLFAQSGYSVRLWRPIVIGLFDTELGLRQEDYPPYLAEAVLKDSEAVVYQWVVRAFASSASGARRNDGANGRAPAISGLWQATRDISRLRTKIDRQDAAIRELEAALATHKHALEEANATLAAIRGSAGYRMLEASRRRIRWLFPPGSRRAFVYRVVRKAARILMYGARWPRIRSRLGRARRLARRSREVIHEEGWREFMRKSRRRLRGQPVPPIAGFIPICYEEWMVANEPDAIELMRQADAALKLPYRPLISIVTPVWNPTPVYLRQTIDSVIAQTYDNWQLCLVDGGSRDPAVKQLLGKYAARDDRIRVKLLPENLGIAGNSNEAMAIASGEYVAFLDHTDLIQPEALWEVATHLNRNPSLDCLYSDEDFISEDGGTRFNPLFKPQWSPDNMLSANYLAHFRVLRRTLIEAVGGERPEMDGAQDWDLLLRLSEKTQRIARIPKVLYHWRMDSTSAAGGIDNKPYALAAQIRAVQGHLDRCGMTGRIEQDSQGIMRVRWRPRGDTRVSIVIPTRHNREVLEPCLRGIARATYRNWEVIVIDTAGRNIERERWYDEVKNIAPLTVLWWDKPFNYSAVNNLGANAAQGDTLLFLNDDTEGLSPDWLEEMVGWSEQPGVGVVGAQLLSPEGKIQHGGDVIGLMGLADHLFAGNEPRATTPLGFTGWYRNSLAATGACLMVRRDLFESIGGFDEDFLLCGSDVDLCLKVRGKGLRTVITPFARVLHHERATRGGRDYGEDCHTSYWRYQSYLHGGDPYFNPNISILSTTPQLRHPVEATAAAAVGPVLGRQVAPQPANPARIETEATAFARACQISATEMALTEKLHAANRGPLEIQSINWFIPDFDSPFYGGIHTILRFADHFKREFGVDNRFIVVGTAPEPYVRSG
ncbi:MAG TPA: glycosyltransferase, partial [Dehalococcoidia bacterium]|nr:glycosyltransferase [Dehalococcoidia bacterium]